MQPRAARLISSICLRHSPDTIRALFQGRQVKNLFPIKILRTNGPNEITVNLDNWRIARFTNYTGRYVYQGIHTVKLKGVGRYSFADIYDGTVDGYADYSILLSNGYADYSILLSDLVPYQCGMILPKGLQEGDVLALETNAPLKFNGHTWG
jgi:hypothetical protein